MRHQVPLKLVACSVVLLAASGVASSSANAADPTAPPALECGQLAASMQSHWPDPSTRITSAVTNAKGSYSPPPRPGAPPMPPLVLPAHCELVGVLHERTGIDGKPYSIRFHLRLPQDWNGRFFFQGGGGSNGVLGDALGMMMPPAAPALLQGFAVVSQDSGHDNAVNVDPARGGVLAFGFDPQARADYGHASLKVVADTAKALVAVYYAKPPQYSYFVGCSKGGQEGMAFAQLYPDEFDGIVASAPGFSLPRAALAEAWDVQSIAEAEPNTSGRDQPLAERLAQFPSVFADADLAVARDAVLEACDSADGVEDGMVSDFEQCTMARVAPKLKAKTCTANQTQGCLTATQVRALMKIFAGPKTHDGKALYSAWQWDAGLASPGWRIWKMGSADGKIPALNIVLGGPSLASVFTTPPTPISGSPEEAFKFQLGFNLSGDGAKIDATNSEFLRSAWADIGARSSDLSGFRAHGGKLIVPHGVSDPVFSIRDTLTWYGEVQHRTGGQAASFVRVFPVPGMNHCGGGPATDNYDAFAALRVWVEEHQAPERILAKAGDSSPWPHRSRPLCPYPKVARYRGQGDIESEANFECR
jgi:hypothetical protein